MISAVTTARGLDGQGWLLGIMGAFVSGGAGAVSSGFSTILVDPEHFNIHAGLGHLLEVMLATFVFSGIVSLAKYLQQHPVPESASPQGAQNG